MGRRSSKLINYRSPIVAVLLSTTSLENDSFVRNTVLLNFQLII